ncbi:hypothetical protein E3P89_00337 [Wallemia ichthyophaga]|uniref:NADP-dependent oxidoreductase domain-containing protein n=1 Tax=Wallemia ichthyophaga TaxID=245174 RepID=A0A4T0ELP6_WALIC|nr:hypothetical protein E3P91_00483 [Wallemia ichthyophaga]TIA84123.1 hypothetical protein E3P98_00351 [Wallemia ichthyophaga]TIA93483.1 hypothetical protein E3P97_00900 [Wallemia ichthyophaga]TIB16315.1 hypothetical protein E3P90_00496 [Wallemia ichthyophaga]TIB18108.1 hypothetical protein E3P93_00353 [Wallemia ichthyophaga]
MSRNLSTPISLADGAKHPILGLGTYLLKDSSAISSAIKNGYRCLDTACYYRNHSAFGAGVHDSGVPRSELFLITKVDPWTGAINNARTSILKSLTEAKLDYWDLVLIHSPESGSKIRMKAYEELSTLVDEGKIRSLGVSNYGKHHINELLASNPRHKPVVNQIEIHPFHAQQELADYCKSKGILVQGYCPLARKYHLKDATLNSVAEKYHTTAANVMLGWSIAKGYVPLPKSGNVDRQNENAKSININISSEDVNTLDGLDAQSSADSQWTIRTVSRSQHFLLQVFDRHPANTFEGQLKQVDHALAAVAQGTTSLGVKASNGVVIATEKKQPSPLVDDSMLEKVALICPTIGCVYSGMGPDFRQLVTAARKSAQAYWKMFNEYPPTRVMVGEIASIMQGATQKGGMRPYGCSLLVAGYDKTRGSSLYQVDPSGSYWAWKASAMGKNMVNAKTFLEKRYNEDISLEDAIHTSLLTLKEGFEGQMTEKTVDIGIIHIPSEWDTKNPPEALAGDKAGHLPGMPAFRKLSEEEIKDHLTL